MKIRKKLRKSLAVIISIITLIGYVAYDRFATESTPGFLIPHCDSYLAKYGANISVLIIGIVVLTIINFLVFKKLLKKRLPWLWCIALTLLMIAAGNVISYSLDNQWTYATNRIDSCIIDI